MVEPLRDGDACAAGPAAPGITDRFRAAVQESKVVARADIPHVSPDVIIEYITDLEFLGLLPTKL